MGCNIAIVRKLKITMMAAEGGNSHGDKIIVRGAQAKPANTP